jgi:hypothetical protein
MSPTDLQRGCNAARSRTGFMPAELMRKRLVDDLVDGYVAWREECLAVEEAYRGWVSAPAADSAFAFATYRMALDREELASGVYADLVARVSRPIPIDSKSKRSTHDHLS